MHHAQPTWWCVAEIIARVLLGIDAPRGVAPPCRTLRTRILAVEVPQAVQGQLAPSWCLVVDNDSLRAVSKTELQLVVGHLGPVEHGEVALRPLTVFIGRNNTGKTYVAQALYACRQAVRSVMPRHAEELSDDERAALEVFARERHDALVNGDIARQGLPAQLHDYVARALRSGLEDTGREVSLRLKATFGVDDLTRITSRGNGEGLRFEVKSSEAGGADICLFSSGGTTAPVGRILRELEIDWTEFDDFYPDFYPLSTLLSQETDRDELARLYSRLAWIMTQGCWHSFLENARLGGSTHYLPAGRSGLLNAWTDVVKLRIQLERERYGLPSFADPSLDGVALDFISSLADVLGPRRRFRPHSFFGSERPSEQDALKPAISLLKVLMEGTISPEPDGEIVPTLAYEQDGHSIAIRHASSMVADLAPLAIWVDRLLAPGDLLIVDEPESHLHPEAIRLMARVLVRLANCGVQVVCATHSSILLNEISNCVLRHETSTSTSDELTPTYTPDDFLAVNDLAIHRFLRDESTKMVTVERVEVDPQWGIPEDEFVKVAEDLTEESARLIGLLD